MYNNITKKYTNIDANNFEQIIKNISDKISKEKVVKYLPNILDELITNNKDFLNLEINVIIQILISELNIETKKEVKETKKELNIETKKEVKETKKEVKDKFQNLNQLSQSIPDTFKPKTNKKDFEIFKLQNLSKVQDKLI